MKKTITLMTAPTSMQPGGYVPKVYADRTTALTPTASVETIKNGNTLQVILEWENKHPIKTIDGDIQTFVDSAAVLAPEDKNSPWITMGTPEQPIDGALWRADKTDPIHITASGLGSVKRGEVPSGWQVKSEWKASVWRVEFTFTQWKATESTSQIAIAIWSGHNAERGGLKSVSQGWLNLE